MSKRTDKPSAIKRLEVWKSKHKSRSVTIDIDDGYGATCWTVDLRYGRKTHEFFVASEAAFFNGEPKDNVTFVLSPGSDDDWPGLEATIHAAIDLAERCGYP